MSGRALADLLKNAGGDDWGSLGQLMAQFDANPEKRERQERDKAAQMAKRQKYLAALAKIFSTPEGELVMDELCNGTLRRITFHTQMGTDPKQAHAYGCFREGQNSVVAALLKDLAEVLGHEFPPEKENGNGWQRTWQRYGERQQQQRQRGSGGWLSRWFGRRRR